MVEIIKGAGHCERVLASRRIIYPRLEKDFREEKCLMVLNDKGKRAQKALKQMTEEGILEPGSYEELEDNVYLLDKPEGRQPDSVSLQIEGSQSRVYFVECSTDHEDHWGRCTPDDFSCGLFCMDVWQKILDCSGPNPLTVSRSYHMDCEPNWVSDEPTPVSEEQQAMIDFGLPLNFGQVKELGRISDEAALVDSYMVEKDYDKELAEMSSSTERMSISKSSRAGSGELTDEIDSFFSHCEPLPGTLSEAEFEKYWLQNGERLTEDCWRIKYGDYIIGDDGCDAAMSEDCSDEGICQDHLADERMSRTNVADESGTNEQSHEAEVNEANTQARQEDVANPSYDAAWSKLWREHAWEVYLQQMNRLLIPDKVSGTSSSGFNNEEYISLGADGSREASGDDLDKTDEGGKHSSSGKRTLSLSEFGLVADDDTCSITTRHTKNHKLKKIKKESHNHKRVPLTVSADALEDAPKDARLAKYWAQRYRLFRKFDEGIRLNEAAWFSVTPEKIAEHIAARICPRAARKSNFVVDGFCGVGGNLVQLGMRSRFVLGVDIDRETIEMAQHNAAIYGVENRIDFVLADMNTFVPRIAPDAVFMSPPWGGPDYKDKAAFDLADMEVNFVEIFRSWRQISPDIAVILPRNTKINQLSELGRVEVEQNLLNKKIKTITAYFGTLVCK